MDVLDVHAHLVGDDLGHGRLDALPVAAGAHVDVDLAAGLDPDGGRVGAQVSALGLDVQGQPDADQAAFGAGPFLVLAELLVADQLGGLLQASRPG